ncbi:hypothetical protein GCM10022245_15390 [Streptomyces mayteni]
MPVASPEVYHEMLDRAKNERYAIPAINVSDSESPHAALRGFSEAGSDGIVQVTVGAATVTWTVATPPRRSAARWRWRSSPTRSRTPIRSTPPSTRTTAPGPGRGPLFQSHMWDGSAVELGENPRNAADLLDEAARAKNVLEVEIGVVGGERGATCWRRRSATCTVCTGRATSSSDRRS